jgi:hypothetical protein
MEDITDERYVRQCKEDQAFGDIPVQITNFTCLNKDWFQCTALRKTSIAAQISLRSGDTEERALEVAEQVYAALKQFIGDIYHPEREIAREDATHGLMLKMLLMD